MDTSITDKTHAFYSRFPKRTYDKGQILVFAGDDPQYIFYLTAGKVRQYDISYRGDEIVVNVFGPPAFFPMSWAINHTPNTYFFQAAEHVEAHLAPPNEALGFIKDNPDVLFDLMSRVYAGVDGLLRRTAHLMSGSAKGRLMHEVIIECRRFGQKQGRAYHIKITEGELGARAGLSRETVSREIHKLSSEGLLSLNRGTIVVNNLEALQDALGATI